MLVVMVAIDASALVCYITRFTEENFATLIAFIFIYKVSIGFTFLDFRLKFNVFDANAQYCVSGG